MKTVWIVESGTQEVNVVCRAFDNERDARIYSATATMWMTLQRERKHSESEFSYTWAPEGFYRHHTAHGYDPKDVIMKLAEADEWPFGTDNYSEYFTVAEYPLGMPSN